MMLINPAWLGASIAIEELLPSLPVCVPSRGNSLHFFVGANLPLVGVGLLSI